MATMLSHNMLSHSTAPSDNTRGLPVQPDPSTNADATPHADAALSDGVAKELVRWFKLLADETRLKILFFLIEKQELNVRTLCDMLGLSQPAVSHHLALLRVDGLIECRRDGKHNYYRVLPQRFGDLMSKVLVAVPGAQSQIRFGGVSLSIASPDSDAGDVAD